MKNLQIWLRNVENNGIIMQDRGICMNHQNILRLALVLSNDQAKSFKTNLLKIIKIVLTDNYPNEITIYEILSSIKENFLLEFSENEILNAITEDKNIIIKNNSDKMQISCRITPNFYEKIEKTETNTIENIISIFLTESNYVSIVDLENCREIILRFLYYTFNNDVKTVLNLMNKNSKYEVEFPKQDFTAEEATLINCFLNWNNQEKNEMILNLVSACYNYCMLTIKKDDKSFSNVFSGKIFYLDANVIFRLAGFNKKERQDVMQSFIKKCKSSGIEIRYTNITFDEIKNTISTHVKALSHVLQNNQPINPEAVSKLDSKYNYLDFYEIYYNWTSKPQNSVGDYEAFEKYLLNTIKRCCNKFKYEYFDSYDTPKNHEDFTQLCSEFSEYKYSKYKTVANKAVCTDINNYLYVVKKENWENANSFVELKNFFITADHCLTEWAALKRPGAVPIFVLPSVWYSILLKYKGRTANDYEAFCKFLNIRVHSEDDPQLQYKRKILMHIMNLNEPSEIKEEIIYDIENSLEQNTNEEVEPEVLVEEALNNTVSKRVAIEINKVSENYKNELDEAKKINLREQQELLQKGENLGVEKYIKMQSNRIAKRNRWIKFSLWVIIVFGLLCLLGLFVKMLFLGKLEETSTIISWYSKNATAIGWIGSLISALFFVLNLILKTLNILPTDEKYIADKLLEKYNNQ